jgi:hypothetical protein
MAKGKTKGQGGTDDRTRNWSFLVYPAPGGQAPDNWRDILDGHRVPWVESPLHDRDVEPTGEIKKPHWHVLMMFGGNKAFEQIKEITDALSAPIPIKAMSTKGLVRYMAHMDNPDKHQYDRAAIVGHCGVDVAELLKPTSADRLTLLKEMMAHVRENQVTEMCDLLEYAAGNRFDDWFRLLTENSAYIMGEYIKSIRHKRKDAIEAEQLRRESEAREAKRNEDRAYEAYRDDLSKGGDGDAYVL